MTWPDVALSDLLQLNIGGVWGKDSGVEDTEVRVWRVTELKAHGRLDPSSAAHRSVPRRHYESRSLQPGDLLLEKSGGGPKTPVGRVGLVRSVPEPAVCANFMQLMRPRTDLVETRFLHLYLNYFHQVGGTAGMQTASTNIRNIKASEYVQLRVPMPPRAEQRRLVGLLEDRLSRLDAADSYLVTAGEREAALHGQLLRSALADVAREEAPLSELLALGLANGRSVPTQDDGFPVLRLTALRDGRIDLGERKGGAWTQEDAARFLVERGDFLISRGNGSLRLVGLGGLVVDEPDAVAYPDTLIRARPNVARVTAAYLAMVWNSPLVRRQIEAAAKTTAGIYKVNQRDLGSIILPVPSLADQAVVVQKVQETRSSLATLAVERTRALARSRRLRRSLLSAAFSGRLTSAEGDA